MKVRTGFVSNSSTTSFCIIGVDTTWATEKLLQACGHDKEWFQETAGFGSAEADNGMMMFYGEYDNGPSWAGLDAETLLVDKTLPQAREWFVKYIQDKLGVVLLLDSVRLCHGEAGDG